ncbi:MAG: hypothetical protein RR993_05155 [Clostridia bacterium]
MKIISKSNQSEYLKRLTSKIISQGNRKKKLIQVVLTASLP